MSLKVSDGWPKFEISKVAETLESQMKFFNCDIDTAWRDYMHDLIKEQVSFKKVKNYMLESILIASKAVGGFNKLSDQTKALFPEEEVLEYERKKLNG